MILSGGFNVYPRNIEEAIYEHPAVEECTVIGVTDPYRGQSAKAFIKLRPNAAAFTFEELKSFLKDKLGKHEMPVAMEIRDTLPKRSEEHTSELQSLMRISYAVFCLKTKMNYTHYTNTYHDIR